jgi:hypothetical protein
LASGILKFKSTFIAALNSTYSRVEQWYQRGNNNIYHKSYTFTYQYGRPHRKSKINGMPTMEEIITNGGATMEIFAVLVSRVMTWNSINSGNRYRLDSQYVQIMTEISQMIKEMVRLIRNT